MLRKTETIRVQGFPVNVEEDYICLTDMAKADGNGARAASVIQNWLRNKSTIEFLSTWESINNPNFKVLEFEHFRERIGSKDFTLSIQEWVEKTGAIGVFARSGKYGGTYAHKDIAIEFGSAISPAFKLYLIKEFQRLKEIESNSNNIEWNLRRVLSKSQYVIQTDAIKHYKIPALNIPADKEHFAYAEEGDILNLAVFGFTAKQWREANPGLATKGQNVRDYASINELMVLGALEGINAEMLKENIPFDQRLEKLKKVVKDQMVTLERIHPQYALRKDTNGAFQPGGKKGITPTKGLPK